LEGGDPSASKFQMKKKQNINKYGYESEMSGLQSPGYDYQQAAAGYPDEASINTQMYAYDDSLPDIIKRSIAQANMQNPLRSVHAPDSFKQQHYSEHVSHTQMQPKAALALAHELETEQKKGGGRGAALFQKRKARAEKWVVEEGKKDGANQQQRQQQQQVYAL